MKNEEFDKNEFNFGKSMLSFKWHENLNFPKNKFDRFAPKHTFMNSVENKAIDQTNFLSSQGILAKLVKRHLKKKIEEKIKKNKNLEEREKKFLEMEGIASSEPRSLSNMIRKYQSLFNLQKYSKSRERDKELRAKQQVKREEMMKRISIKKQERGVFEEKIQISNINNPKYEDLLQKSLKKSTNDLQSKISHNITKTVNVMNMIRAKVEDEMQKNNEEIEEFDQSATRKKHLNLRKNQSLNRKYNI